MPQPRTCPHCGAIKTRIKTGGGSKSVCLACDGQEQEDARAAALAARAAATDAARRDAANAAPLSPYLSRAERTRRQHMQGK